ncbi:MAG: prepilin-type N-terminal cleavage/methylation domain-containing protein [bacterium]
MKKRRASKGFTLVEMMIVIAILAILYSIAAVNIMGLQTEAKVAKTNGDLKTLKLGLDSYIKNNNTCPKKEDYQRILIRETSAIITGNLFDPFGRTMNTLYSFEVSGNKENYVVYSIGQKKDGKSSIGNDGRVLTEGSAIFETNGYD